MQSRILQKMSRKYQEIIITIIGDIDEYHNILQKMKNKNTVGEIDCQFMDYEKVKDYFGWTPQHSFNDGILKTVDWYKRYFRD